MTTPTFYLGNPTDEDNLQARIDSLEAAVESLERDNRVLARKTKLTVADIANIYLKKAQTGVTIINFIALTLVLSVFSIGFDLAATSTEFVIHSIVMTNRSAIQIAIDKFIPHGFDFIGTFIHNLDFSIIAVSATIGSLIMGAIIFAVSKLALDDLA